jgi:hypothetical protein
MSAEDEHGAYRYFLDGFHKYSATATQLVDDVTVVHDLVMNVNRAPISFKS